ncbi:hypothetical protein [Mucisphaera calidilacus]|uniref:PEP-CTERM protein-sorting domain-containing protein n=1 Tax=Mucisphaera calidilacus TaxID=2527982 RepID=A0A518BYD9_9BACT|nr:hypothetical protein [Mucisphaera calidilacus]QDU71976.1 hypothetical protein Pan265_18350 [Mucisphaera calidilacus]
MKRMLMSGLLAGLMTTGAMGADSDLLDISFVPTLDDGLEQIAAGRIRGWSTGWEAGTGLEVGVPGHANASWNWSSAVGAQSFVWELVDGVSTLSINGRMVMEGGLDQSVTDLSLQLRATDYRDYTGSLSATGLTLTVDGQAHSLPDLLAESGWSGLLRVGGLDGGGAPIRLEGTLTGNFHEIKEERIKIDMRAYHNPAAVPELPEPSTMLLGAAGIGFLLLRRGS